MTDLERVRRMLREWGEEADVVIADELAAARRGATSMSEPTARDEQRMCAELDRRAERVPAQYYDFPYDGHAVFHPSWGLRIQVLDDGYAQMSATEARRFSDWLAGLVRNVPAPQSGRLDVV